MRSVRAGLRRARRSATWRLEGSRIAPRLLALGEGGLEEGELVLVLLLEVVVVGLGLGEEGLRGKGVRASWAVRAQRGPGLGSHARPGRGRRRRSCGRGSLAPGCSRGERAAAPSGARSRHGGQQSP